MAERKNHTAKKDNDFIKAEIGYRTGVQLVGLVSQEIYSRFSAMLTANSIILGIIGLVYTSTIVIIVKTFILFTLSIIGLIFCGIWFSFNEHGIHYQKKFRKEVTRLEEKYFNDTFKLMIETKKEDSKEEQSNDINDKKISSYEKLSNYLIDIFLILYSGIIIILLILTFMPILGF